MNIMSLKGPYAIGPKIISEFEEQVGQKNSRPVEVFLRRLVDERPYVRFLENGLCFRLLKLLPETTLHFRQQARILLFFRSRTGLPLDLFEDDIKLQGKDDSIPCSRRLLEICFPWFKKESSPKMEFDTVNVPLGKEALICFQNYVFAKRISEWCLPVLQELLDFSYLINGKAFQSYVLSVAARTLRCNLKINLKEVEFNLNLTEGQFRNFVRCYFKVVKVETKILRNGRHSISLKDYAKAFDYKDHCNILHLIAKEIDEVQVNNKDYPVLQMVLPTIALGYRSQIVSVKVPKDIGRVNLKKLIEVFPNYRPMERSKILKKGGDSLKPETQLLQYRAFTLRKKGKLDEAAIILREIMEDNLHSYFAFLELGLILSLKNKDDEAIIVLQRAIELNPKAIKPHRLLAMIYMRKNQLEDAEKVLQMGLACSKDIISQQLLVEVLSKKMAALTL